MRVAIAIATTGRPAIVAEAVRRLGELQPPPARVVVVGADPADVEGVKSTLPLTVVLTERGTCRQRNRALATIGSDADIVAFLDDDYVPVSDFVAGVERTFGDYPDVVVATGRVIADGINSPGLTFEEADALIAADQAAGPQPREVEPRSGAYGCNMVIRQSAIGACVFDEDLPLYGWQEDIDFTAQVGRRGRIVWTNDFAGVHLGVKSGRTSGVRLGYSQAVNPIYLARKGTLGWGTAFSLMARNFAANAVKSFFPEPYVDRRGRLVGNLLGVRDLALRKAHPSRILQL